MTQAQVNNLVILQAELLQENKRVVFGMSTRAGGVSPEPLGMNLSFRVGDAESNVRTNRELFFARLGIRADELALPMQVHSGTVRNVYEPGLYPDCDALITNRRRVFLGVSVADCVPLFLFDRRREVVAAVHAGWRGTAKRIAERTIEQMVKDFSCRAADIVAFIGPSAGDCCYEVGTDVAALFDERFVRHREEKFFVDLKNANAAQLVGLHVPPSSVEISSSCTICQSSLFHSYRRDRERSGRMMAVIGLQ